MIEFKYRDVAGKHHYWIKFQSPNEQNNVIPNHCTYLLRIDDVVYEDWTPEFLMAAYEREKIWKGLQK